MKCACGGLTGSIGGSWFAPAPLRDEQGNLVKWYGVCIDIEDRKRAEEALRSTESEQRHNSRAIGKRARSLGRGSGGWRKWEVGKLSCRA